MRTWSMDILCFRLLQTANLETARPNYEESLLIHEQIFAMEYPITITLHLSLYILQRKIIDFATARQSYGQIPRIRK